MPDELTTRSARRSLFSAREYRGLKPGQPMDGQPVDLVFIGSCTNGRIEDLREAAKLVQGKRVADSVQALVVPGSKAVKAQAEKEGLDRIFSEAGFEWRGAGCSMCLAMNEDKAGAGKYVASTSNRNFQGRQGPGARSLLMSPIMAAAAAVNGRVVDVRDAQLEQDQIWNRFRATRRCAPKMWIPTRSSRRAHRRRRRPGDGCPIAGAIREGRAEADFMNDLAYAGARF